MTINTTDHLCIECKACLQSCTKQAIHMVENEEGFSYPEIDSLKCVDCGLCVKVCPEINASLVKNPIGKVYAVQNNDSKILRQSSSGGVFSLIAESIIDRGGIVYGAAWNKKMKLRHIGVDSVKELSILRGSKYVHSDIGDTYIEVRDHLKKGRWVYYTGTPCQIAGLKLFLRKDYPTLITSDLICHGTPSQKLFDIVISQIESESKKSVLDYKFRDKMVSGWGCCSPSAILKNNNKQDYCCYDPNMEAYSRAFVKGHISREDCYQCPFSTPERVGDITLADYWNVRKMHSDIKFYQLGISLVLINTKKAMDFIDIIKHKADVYESSIEKALETSNSNLRIPTPRPKERDLSYKEAFYNFSNFREKYLTDPMRETNCKKAYFRNRIKQMTLVNSILRLIGKAK